MQQIHLIGDVLSILFWSIAFFVVIGEKFIMPMFRNRNRGRVKIHDLYERVDELSDDNQRLTERYTIDIERFRNLLDMARAENERIKADMGAMYSKIQGQLGELEKQLPK